MEQCATFNASTGFEEIEFFRRETQVAATSIIATTVVISQILLLLLFLPLAQLPKCMRKLDIELNFEEIFSKKKNKSTQSESETDSLIADEKEQSKRRKRASGGVATMIIIVILIIVSTTTFVVTSESPGTVSYQTNQLSSDENLLDKSSTAFGIIFDFVMARGRIINAYLVYSQSTLITNELRSKWRYNQTCELDHITIKNMYGRAPFALDLGMFSNVSPYRARMTQTYATVCRSLTSSSDRSFSLNAYTPVAPVLSNYPPPGIFTDGPAIIKNREVATSTTVPVVSFTWTWTEMVSTSILDLLAPLSMSRTLQAKVESELSTRGINSTFTFYNPDGTTVELPWPSCDKLPSGYVPVLSFIMSYQPGSPKNISYIVSARSFLSWAFATLITLGSVIALKPTITNYLDKLSTYWRMKLWARWTLFALYTLLMPLPMLFVLLKFITDQKRFVVRGADHYYAIRMFILLIVMAGLLMLSWVGVLARHIYMTRQERMKRREKEEQSNVLIVEPENASYEQIM